MRDVIKVYDIELIVDGPVFIGSGSEIAKKEYALLKPEHMVAVMDQIKLYRLLENKHMLDAYLQFMLSGDKADVGTWLYKNHIRKQEYLNCEKYQLDYGDAEIDTHSKLSIMEFVKDAYGLPYIPGSSLKGMMRTVLLAADLIKQTEKYQDISRKIAVSRDEKAKRNYYLKSEAAEIENRFYRTRNRPNTRPADAVNDIMSGFIVSDSEPLALSDLILCQKIERHADGKEKKMNVLRESLRPGTKVHFQLSLDTSVCNITKESIEKAILEFGSMYYDVFLQKYGIIGKPKENTVWLGGGSGFITKTEVYPLLGKNAGLRKTVDIFKATGMPAKHRDDLKLGVSPHICKMTYYQKQLCQMGAARLFITEKT